MTVAELIAELAKHPLDADVHLVVVDPGSNTGDDVGDATDVSYDPVVRVVDISAVAS